MRKQFYTFIFIFLGCLSPANSQSINQRVFPKNKNGESLFWYEIQYETCSKLKLEHLINSTDSFRFRYFTINQILDIWTKDGKVYNGKLINYTERYIDSEKKYQKRKKPKIFYDITNIDTTTIRKLLGFINEIAIIPSDENIENWSSGLDGEEYIIETSTNQTYSFKTYWTPNSQDSSLIEAQKIKKFISDIETCLAMKKKYKNFFFKLRRGYYINDNLIQRKRSKHAQKIWDRQEPDRNYILSKRDTLNNFWTDTLNIVLQNHKWKYLDQNDMILIFSKHNRLKWIHANRNFKDNKERINFYKDCITVLNAVRKIHIDFVDPKVSYWKRLLIFESENKLLLR